MREDRRGVLAAFRKVRTGARVSHAFRIRRPKDGEERWLAHTEFPLCDAQGQVQRIGGIGSDVTEAKRTTERQDVLVKELQHRSRNLLGVVTSLATRTIGQGASVESFTARLKALSRAQALLSQSGGDAVEVGAMVRAELAAYADAATRVSVSGPRVLLGSEQVQNFALALHELATNAAKYGALLAPTGRLSVSWERARAGGEAEHLALTWIESGVPVEPEATRRQGFGRELIERALAYALRARTAYELGPDGVRCRIEMPLA